MDLENIMKKHAKKIILVSSIGVLTGMGMIKYSIESVPNEVKLYDGLTSEIYLVDSKISNPTINNEEYLTSLNQTRNMLKNKQKELEKNEHVKTELAERSVLLGSYINKENLYSVMGSLLLGLLGPILAWGCSYTVINACERARKK